MKISVTTNKIIRENLIYKVFLWAVTGYLILRFMNYLAYAANMILYPYDLDAGEGLIINRSWLLSRGENIYPSIDHEPYFVMNYTPLFEFILAGLVKVFGPQIMLGRILSVGSAVLSGFFIYKIVYNLSQRHWSAAIAGLMFFTSAWLTSWSVLCRIDVFALMFVLAGLSLLSDENRRHHAGMIILSGICFTAALFSRQSMVAAPVACMAAYLLFVNQAQDKKRHWMELKLLMGVMAGLITVIFIALQTMTHGEFFRHSVLYTLGTFDIDNFQRWIAEYLKTHWIVTLISAAWIVFVFLSKKISLPVLFWMSSLAVTLTAGKLGSSINYFLEFWSASCILTGLAISHFENNHQKLGKTVGSILLMVLLAVQLIIFQKRIDFTLPADEYRQASKDLSELISRAPGDVISEYTGYSIQNGKKFIYQSFSMAQLSLSGMWSEEKILNDIKNHRFDLIVLTGVGMGYDRWTPQFKDTVNKYYKVTKTFPCFELSYYHSTINVHYVYAPKGPQD